MEIKKVLNCVFIMFVLVILVGFGLLYFFALQESPPEHSLDFQNINEVALKEKINSIDQGFEFAMIRAKEWRKDAKLTRVEVVLDANKKFEYSPLKYNYIFEFKYINEKKPGGILFVSINPLKNCIDLVSTSHDGIDQSQSFKELNYDKINETAKKAYAIACSRKEIKQSDFSKNTTIRITLDAEKAVAEFVDFESGGYSNEKQVVIDLKTFSVLKKSKN